MKEMKLIPRRRFAEFSNEWKPNKLDDLGRFGKTYAYSRAKEGNGEYHHIHYGDIHVKYNGFITENTLVPSLSVQGDFEVLKENDIVIADASEDYKDLGKTAIIQAIDNKKIIAGLHTFKFTPNENLNSKFYLYYSQTNLFKNFSYRTGTGISVFGISKANISKMQLNIPKQEEQQKIGEFFMQLDQMITHEQRKLEKTKAFKSAYLAEMFPAEGEHVPKRRFAGFEEAWRPTRISDIFIVTRGNVLSASIVKKKKDSIMQYPVYSSQTLNNGLLGYYSDYLFDTAITWTTDGANAGTVNYREGKFYSTNVNGVLISDKGYANKAVAEALNLVAWRHVSKVGNPKLMNNIMGDIVIQLPTSIEELEKMSTFINRIDDTINNQQQKLDKLKAIKQAYLQEMFV